MPVRPLSSSNLLPGCLQGGTPDAVQCKRGHPQQAAPQVAFYKPERHEPGQPLNRRQGAVGAVVTIFWPLLLSPCDVPLLPLLLLLLLLLLLCCKRTPRCRLHVRQRSSTPTTLCSQSSTARHCRSCSAAPFAAAAALPCSAGDPSMSGMRGAAGPTGTLCTRLSRPCRLRRGYHTCRLMPHPHTETRIIPLQSHPHTHTDIRLLCGHPRPCRILRQQRQRRRRPAHAMQEDEGGVGRAVAHQHDCEQQQH